MCTGICIYTQVLVYRYMYIYAGTCVQVYVYIRRYEVKFEIEHGSFELQYVTSEHIVLWFSILEFNNSRIENQSTKCGQEGSNMDYSSLYKPNIVIS
mgnify:CR=1 FL=1